MKKEKVVLTVLVCIVLILGVAYLFIGNPLVFMNNHKLANSVTAIETETVSLSEVIPFDWDVVYTFEPYQSKESIEEIVGFTSSDIEANNINEGMVHVLFVKGNRVTASVLGYSNNLGYEISLSPEMKITYSENAQFRVAKSNGITTLSLIQ